MAKHDVNARKSSGAADGAAPVTMTRRVLWVLLAGMWLFLFVSLASFNSADPPSHVVAVHNEPPANLCGVAGAVIAYWSYAVIGVGIWVIMVGLAAWLAVTVTGRIVTHPVVRLVGLILMALTVSSMHALLLPQAGPMAGAHGGLMAEFIVAEMTPRFNHVGTFLLLIAALGVGAIVTSERIVIALPILIWAGLVKLVSLIRRVRMPDLSGLRARPEASLAAAVTTGKQKSKSNGNGAGRIDPDAGGVGATESFDPDDYEEDEEFEYDDEDDDEYEYVDEDDDEEDEEDTPQQERKRLTADELKAKISKLPCAWRARRKPSPRMKTSFANRAMRVTSSRRSICWKILSQTSPRRWKRSSASRPSSLRTRCRPTASTARSSESNPAPSSRSIPCSLRRARRSPKSARSPAMSRVRFAPRTSASCPTWSARPRSASKCPTCRKKRSG
jgi:hypothetical protein